MINYFYNKIKNSVKESYEKSLEKLQLNKTACPKCRAKGFYKDHGGYNRHVIALLDNRVIHEIIWVKRVKCLSCKSTHALLPSFILPYHSYTYSIILKCLDEKVISKKKVEEITEAMNISFQLLYTWLKRFKSQHILSNQVFREGILSLKECLTNILVDIGGFLSQYFKEHQTSFMQNNQSP